MGKKQQPNDALSISRCKRMIRPLISKIAALTDIYIKYPSKFDLDIESFDIVQRNHGKSLSFISPATSEDRLLSLKPYLSPELHQAYKEIVVIFKNIILAWSQNSSDSKIPKLSSLSSYKVGKCITLGTKSSHYRLSQTALFDADTLPKYLQKYHDELSDDIDEWLTMEPESVMDAHRTDLLYGYLIHLLVFNSRTIFYCLLPVLVHWLREQESKELHALSRTLLYEFFVFSSVDSDQRAVAELTSEVAQHDPSLPVFWLFHNIGYWKRLCELCNLTTIEGSAAQKYQPYDCIFLDVLAKTDRLFLTDGIDLQHVYNTLQQNPQHPHNTFILTSILAQIISLFKKSLDSASTSSASITVLRASLNDFTEFLRTWLSLSGECVFNSFDSGNEEMFEALGDALAYMVKHGARAIRYLEDVSGKHAEKALKEFINISQLVRALHVNTQILRAYYLDEPDLFDISGSKVSETSRSLAELMAHNCEYNEVVDFLVWFRDLEDPQGYSFSKSLCKRFFREDSVLGDMDIDHVAWELYDL